MKRRYQIKQQRAVNEFRQLATNQNPNIQMMLPMAEIVGLLQQGVGHLLREAGLALMSLVMEEEVRHLAGERHQQHAERRAHRWGQEDGYCVIDGQKVPIQRTRLRNVKRWREGDQIERWVGSGLLVAEHQPPLKAMHLDGILPNSSKLFHRSPEKLLNKFTERLHGSI